MCVILYYDNYRAFCFNERARGRILDLPVLKVESVRATEASGTPVQRLHRGASRSGSMLDDSPGWSAQRRHADARGAENATEMDPLRVLQWNIIGGDS